MGPLCLLLPIKVIGGGSKFFLVNFPVRAYVIGLNERKLPLFTEFKTLALLPRYRALNVAKIPSQDTFQKDDENRSFLKR